MYWHYVRHGLRPSDYIRMGPGERAIMRAFMIQENEEIEEIEEENKRIKAEGGM